jgi:hypothetical protein
LAENYRGTEGAAGAADGSFASARRRICKHKTTYRAFFSTSTLSGRQRNIPSFNGVSKGKVLRRRKRNPMTLLDAPVYDQARTRKRRNILISAACLCGVVAIVVFLCWNLPAEHKVNEFFAAVEAQDFPKAFGIWNNDADWQQHAQRYAATGYPYGRFVIDWGKESDYGVITSHKILHSTSRYGSETLLGVEINGRKAALITLAVEKGKSSMSFPPFALTPMKNGFGWTTWPISYH